MHKSTDTLKWEFLNEEGEEEEGWEEVGEELPPHGDLPPQELRRVHGVDHQAQLAVVAVQAHGAIKTTTHLCGHPVRVKVGEVRGNERVGGTSS